MFQNELAVRVTGFVGCIALTLLAYFVILDPDFFHLRTTPAMTTILILAVLQFMVQFVFFLNLWREKGPPWNLGVFVSTVSILFIIIFFSIWIMRHLEYVMMP